MVKFYNKKYKDRSYKISQKVILFWRNIYMRKINMKFADKYLRLFKIIRIISKTVYKLNLLKSYRRVYSTFYMTFSELYCRRKRVILPDPINIDNKQEWEIK